MTGTQLQTPDAFPNVLHDQGIPNTLGGIGPLATRVRLRLPAGVVVAIVAGLVAVLAVLMRGAT